VELAELEEGAADDDVSPVTVIVVATVYLFVDVVEVITRIRSPTVVVCTS
jgi:hypothetical protein